MKYMRYTLTITKALNRLNLIKFFRKEKKGLELATAIYYADNLPYSFQDISQIAFDQLKEEIKDFAEYEFLTEEDEYQKFINQNINPPLEYIEANEWYESLPDKEKEYVNQIGLWRSRPAAC